MSADSFVIAVRWENQLSTFYDDDDFKLRMRANRSTFQQLVSYLRGDMEKQRTNWKVPVPVEKRIAAALYFMGHGGDAAHNGSAAQTEVPCVTAGHTGLTVPSVTAGHTGKAVHTGEHMRTDSQQRAAESLNPERAADSVARVHRGILAKWNRQVTGSYRPVGFPADPATVA